MNMSVKFSIDEQMYEAKRNTLLKNIIGNDDFLAIATAMDARIESISGDFDEAKAKLNDVLAYLNKLSWNGSSLDDFIDKCAATQNYIAEQISSKFENEGLAVTVRCWDEEADTDIEQCDGVIVFDWKTEKDKIAFFLKYS